MGRLEENDFIKRLEEGKNTKVMLMAHNAYWCQLEKFKRRYNNLEVSVFGSGTAYARVRKKDIPKDGDFIILDGSGYYSEEEFYETKKMAMKMSKENNKRVSMGYVYFISEDKRPNANTCSEIKIASFKNDNIDEETLSISTYDLLSIADIIVKIHNELENQVVFKKL